MQDRCNKKGSMQIVTREVTRREFTIEFPPISTKRKQMAFKDRIRREFEKNEGVLRILDGDQYIFNGLERPVIIRMATPKELGYEHNLNPWSVDDVAKKRGLVRCSSFVPLRIAIDFEGLRKRLPAEYLGCGWWIHMSTLEAMTGDMFVSGFGCPRGMFEIYPSYVGSHVLSVSWIYGGRREGVYTDQPIVFQCTS